MRSSPLHHGRHLLPQAVVCIEELNRAEGSCANLSTAHVELAPDHAGGRPTTAGRHRRHDLPPSKLWIQALRGVQLGAVAAATHIEPPGQRSCYRAVSPLAHGQLRLPRPLHGVEALHGAQRPAPVPAAADVEPAADRGRRAVLAPLGHGGERLPRARLGVEAVHGAGGLRSVVAAAHVHAAQAQVRQARGDLVGSSADGP
mmetsp:Transcript_26357/g.54634  ORF Transcript_26357/g.54634 Transcript_26357/m.54634 type:complete len:201 (+) Transcript_26357:306-908(+)